MQTQNEVTIEKGVSRGEARRAFLGRVGVAGSTAAGAAIVLAAHSKPVLAMGSNSKSRSKVAKGAYS